MEKLAKGRIVASGCATSALGVIGKACATAREMGAGPPEPACRSRPWASLSLASAPVGVMVRASVVENSKLPAPAPVGVMEVRGWSESDQAPRPCARGGDTPLHHAPISPQSLV